MSLAFLERLIRLKTLSSDTGLNKTALEMIRKHYFSKTDYSVREYERNGKKSMLVSLKKYDQPRFRVLLNGHIDVVQGKIEQFNARASKDKLYGRGAYDMKGGLFAMMNVFAKLSKKLSYPLGLQIVCDEEIGGFDGTLYQLEQGVRADFVIIGEPTDLKVCNEAKGIYWFRATARGTSSHGAYPWRGKNAILTLNRFITKLNKKFPEPKKEYWKTMVNIGSIKSINTAANVVPDEASVVCDVRFTPDDMTYREVIQNIAGKNITISPLLYGEAHFVPRNNVYVTKLVKAIQKTNGLEKEFFVKQHGGSDARHFMKYHVPAVCFGPVGSGHHMDNEWVSMKSLTKYEKILEDFLVSL